MFDLNSIVEVINSFIFKNYIFSYSIVLGVFAYIRYKVAVSNKFLAGLFFFPSTIIHEFLHFFIGLITFAKPSSFSVLPKKDENGNYTLGEVQLRNLTFYNSIPTALAPILMFVMLYYIDSFYWGYLKEDITYFILYAYINFTFIFSGIPSGQDFKVAFSNIFGVIFYIALVAIGIFYLDNLETLLTNML